MIELLVVIIVIGILTSISTVSFFDFHHTQILQSATNDVAATLNVAKSNSVSQLKSSPFCLSIGVVLNGYKVAINNSTTYSLQAVCSGIDVPLGTKTLPQNITFTSATPATFLFTVLTGEVIFTTGGVGVPGPQTITLSGFGKTRNIAVSSTGVIQ